MRKADIIIGKIQKYRIIHNKLPVDLTDIGYVEEEGYDVVYYYRKDNVHYTLSFPIYAEDHKYYYSDSNRWEYWYRDMK